METFVFGTIWLYTRLSLSLPPSPRLEGNGMVLMYIILLAETESLGYGEQRLPTLEGL